MTIEDTFIRGMDNILILFKRVLIALNNLLHLQWQNSIYHCRIHAQKKRFRDY